MSNIIEFKPKKKEEVLNKPPKRKPYPGPKNKYFIKNTPVDEPVTRYDYLDLCKKFLPEKKYIDMMCGICDKEYYDKIDPTIQKLVDNYYQFDVK